jgi:hypothetical protein
MQDPRIADDTSVIRFQNTIFLCLGTLHDVVSSFVFLDTTGTILMYWRFTYYNRATTGMMNGHLMTDDGVIVIDTVVINGYTYAKRVGDEFIVDGVLKDTIGAIEYLDDFTPGPCFNANRALIEDILHCRFTGSLTPDDEIPPLSARPPGVGDRIAAPPPRQQAIACTASPPNPSAKQIPNKPGSRESFSCFADFDASYRRTYWRAQLIHGI